MSFVEAFERTHRKSLEAFNRGNFDLAFSGLADDVEWHMLPILLETGVVRGREAVLRYFHGVRDAIDWKLEAQEFVEAGEGCVVVHQRGIATGRTTGISSGNFDFFQVWEVGSDGLIVRVREFEEQEDALDAARGSPD
jgi:ketosteroid isomerase-like protein